MASQKQTVILIVIVASLISFLGGYLLTQPQSAFNSVVQQQRGNLIDRFDGVTQTTSPTPLPPGLLQAIPDAVLAPTNAPDGEAVLYYQTGGVSRLDLETRKITLASQVVLPGLTQVIWSPDKNRVVTVQRNSKGLQYSYFDYITRQHGSLGANISDVAFSPDSSQLVVVRNSGDAEEVIQISDFNGQNLRNILKTRLSDIKLSWPRAEMVAFSATDTDQGTQSLYSLALKGDLNQIIGEVEQLSVRWAPNGSTFIYSEQGTEIPTLHLFDLASKTSRVIPVQAIAENCDWSSDNIRLMCMAQTGGETSVLEFKISDLSSKLLFSHLIITPEKVFLSSLGNFLVATNLADRSLWAIKLPAN